jgi:hypothetical protein
MRLFAAVVLCSTAAAANPAAAGKVGIYPLQLPHGNAQLAARAVADLRDANGAPVVLVGPSACAPDEDVCLASAARREGLTRIVSAAVDASASGYKLHVRAFSADEKLVGEWSGEGQELAETLQRGVDASLGSASAPVENAPSETAAEAVPDQPARDVVPREPSTQVAPRAPVAEAIPPEVLAHAPPSTAREKLELGLFTGGLGLLSAAAGVALYAHVQPSHGAGNATPTASTFAIALAATGLGSIAASGLVVALTPSAATLQTRF